VNLRRATAGDVEAVAGLERELFGADAWSTASVAEELTGPRRHAVVACDADGRVTGYAVTRTGDDVVDVQRVAVAPGHRRTGLARRLLAEVSRARAEPDGQRAASRMLLEVSADNAPALALYASAGFVEIARRRHYYRDGSDALVLQARLDDDSVADAWRSGS
jgi:[ribosomal protein S18]-alanine N-acetyltransferase